MEGTTKINTNKWEDGWDLFSKYRPDLTELNMDLHVDSSRYSMHFSFLYKTKGSHEVDSKFLFSKNFLHGRVEPVACLFCPEIHGFIACLLSTFYVWGSVFDLGDIKLSNEESLPLWSSPSALEVLTVGYLLSLPLSSSCWNWLLKNMVICIPFCCVSPVIADTLYL